jgi:putative ABC transport system permease protein
MIDVLLQDIRYGLRTLIKNPGVSLLAIFALGLGIAGNTAIFSIVNAIMLRPLPVQDPNQLVMLFESKPQAGLMRGLVSYSNFNDWREQNKVFEGMAAFTTQPFNISTGADPENISAARVSGDFFRLIKSGTALGNTFSEDDHKAGSNQVVLLSHGLWQRRFGSDPNIVGKTLTLDSAGYTVLGVMPADFQFPTRRAELWTPLIIAPSQNDRDVHNLNVIARLKPDASLAQAQTELNAISVRLQEGKTNAETSWNVTVIPLADYIVGNIKPAFIILFAAVGFVLLIACTNVVNLLLARAAARQKEIAIRAALGATRARIVRQLLTESTLLSLLGGALGLLLAFLGLKFLLANLPGQISIPRVEDIGIDSQVLGFTLIISLLTGVICGLAPAWRLSKPDLNETLKEVVKGSTGALNGRRVRNLLVVSEVALALMLLCCAGLMIKSFLVLQQVDPGFNARNVLTMQISLPKSKYTEDPQIASFYQQALERTATLPGVQAAGIVNHLPLSGETTNVAFTIEGRAPVSAAEELYAGYRSVSPDYFNVMGVPLKKGRGFTERDTAQALGAVVINETMAKRYWPNEDPIDKHLKQGDLQSKAPWLTVVGVVGDVRHSAINLEPRPEMYQPFPQEPLRAMWLTVRTASDPKSLAPAVRSAILSVDKDQPVSNIRTMEELISDANFGRRTITVLLIVFAVLALILATMGIYGVLSYSVAQRKKEIGIRMALGAQGSDVLRMILKQGLKVVLLGVVIGVGLTLIATRFMSSLLYGVSGSDPVTLIGVSLFLGVVGVIACLIPARRATKLDPMHMLRYE